jgi:hypothetical protein
MEPLAKERSNKTKRVRWQHGYVVEHHARSRMMWKGDNYAGMGKEKEKKKKMTEDRCQWTPLAERDLCVA